MTWGIQRTWAWICWVSVELSLATYSTQVETVHLLGIKTVLYYKWESDFIVLKVNSYCKINSILWSLIEHHKDGEMVQKRKDSQVDTNVSLRVNKLFVPLYVLA